MKKNLILLAVILVLLGFVGYKYNFHQKLSYSLTNTLSPDEAKSAAEKIINEQLVNPGTKFEIGTVTEENGLYRVPVKIGDQEIISYMSQDGKKFFPEAVEAEPKKEAAQAQATPEQDIPKSDLPQVDLFVMSYCPYGTQIEKGIIPVLETLGNKIKFNLKFVSYAMHDKKELDENLRQYCIQKEEPTKLIAYLTNFLKKGQGTENDSMAQAGVSASKINTCMAAADKEFKITENYNNKSTWSNGQFPPFNVDKEDNTKYGVGGSPTLVINGQIAKSQRDAKSLLSVICSGFNSPPQECQKELPSAAPSAGFGEGTGSNGSASCGS